MGKTFRGKERENFRKYNMRGHGAHKRNAGDEAYNGVQRVYCSMALSTKWLFKTKESAIEHIKFNARARYNKGKEPKFERAYYCRACDGWHITTKEYKFRYFTEEERENHKKLEKGLEK